MVQASQTPVIWTIIIATIVLAIGGLFVYQAIPTADEVAKQIDVPTTTEIQSMIDNVDVPTAEEIAALVDIPEAEDTMYSVVEEKRNLAIELAEDEMNTRDFKDYLADEINGAYTLDISRSDIETIEVRDIDTDDNEWYAFSEFADVDFIVKVTFDETGDKEWTKVHVYCDIEGLDWVDDYEDADVTDCHIGQFTTNSLD